MIKQICAVLAAAAATVIAYQVAYAQSPVITNTRTNLTYTTFSAAIGDTNTQDGDTLVLSSGTFNENVIITKSLTIRGAGVGASILSPTTALQPVIVVSANAVTLTQFSVVGLGASEAISTVPGVQGLKVLTTHLESVRRGIILLGVGITSSLAS